MEHQTFSTLVVYIAYICFAGPSWCDQIDNDVRVHMRQHQVPSACVIILKDGQLLKESVYGLSSIEFKVPATNHTLYESSVISKMISRSALLLLADQGKIRLSAPAKTYVKMLPANWSVITAKQLLTGTNLPATTSLCDGSDSCDDLRDALTVKIIEAVTRHTYWDFLHTNILEPLGMLNTHVDNVRDIVSGKALLYDRDSSGAIVRCCEECGLKVRRFNTSSSDIAKWQIALATGKLIDPKSVTMLWESLKSTATRLGYSSQITVMQDKTSAIARDQVHGLIVVVLTNSVKSSAGDLTKDIATRMVVTKLRLPE